MTAIEVETAGAVATIGRAPALGAADRLGFAAAPTFAFMALITAASGGQPDMLCGAMDGGAVLSGMVPMYLLMSAFHLSPWLKLVSRRRIHARRP